MNKNLEFSVVLFLTLWTNIASFGTIFSFILIPWSAVFIYFALVCCLKEVGLLNLKLRNYIFHRLEECDIFGWLIFLSVIAFSALSSLILYGIFDQLSHTTAVLERYGIPYRGSPNVENIYYEGFFSKLFKNSPVLALFVLNIACWGRIFDGKVDWVDFYKKKSESQSNNDSLDEGCELARGNDASEKAEQKSANEKPKSPRYFLKLREALRAEQREGDPNLGSIFVEEFRNQLRAVREAEEEYRDFEIREILKSFKQEMVEIREQNAGASTDAVHLTNRQYLITQARLRSEDRIAEAKAASKKRLTEERRAVREEYVRLKQLYQPTDAD